MCQIYRHTKGAEHCSIIVYGIVLAPLELPAKEGRHFPCDFYCTSHQGCYGYAREIVEVVGQRDEKQFCKQCLESACASIEVNDICYAAKAHRISNATLLPVGDRIPCEDDGIARMVLASCKLLVCSPKIEAITSKRSCGWQNQEELCQRGNFIYDCNIDSFAQANGVVEPIPAEVIDES